MHTGGMWMMLFSHDFKNLTMYEMQVHASSP
jgi:hypothetical protein